MICPYCGSDNVSHSRSPFVSGIRMLINSRKRYCADCNKKFALHKRKNSATHNGMDLLWIAGLIGGALLYFCASTNWTGGYKSWKDNLVQSIVNGARQNMRTSMPSSVSSSQAKSMLADARKMGFSDSDIKRAVQQR